MPINPGQAIASQSEQQNELLKQFLQGNQQLQAGAQAQAGKDLTASSNLQTAQQLHQQNPNATVKVGDTEIGGGFGMLNAGANQAHRLDSDFHKNVQPLHDSANSLAAGVNGLIQGSAAGDELASVIKARMVEGKGSRVLGSIVNAFGAPKSAAGDVQTLSNYIQGTPASKMTPEQRSAVAALYNQQLDSLEKQIGIEHNKFIQTAAGKAPILSASGQLQPYLSNYGNPSTQTIADARKKLADFSAGKFASAPSSDQQGGGPVDKLKQLIGLGAKSDSGSQSTGPHGQSVKQNGVTYTWNPQSGQYE